MPSLCQIYLDHAVCIELLSSQYYPLKALGLCLPKPPPCPGPLVSWCPPPLCWMEYVRCKLSIPCPPVCPAWPTHSALFWPEAWCLFLAYHLLSIELSLFLLTHCCNYAELLLALPSHLLLIFPACSPVVLPAPAPTSHTGLFLFLDKRPCTDDWSLQLFVLHCLSETKIPCKASGLLTEQSWKTEPERKGSHRGHAPGCLVLSRLSVSFSTLRQWVRKARPCLHSARGGNTAAFTNFLELGFLLCFSG